MYKALIFDFFGVFCPDISFDWLKQSVPDYQAILPEYKALCAKSDYGLISRADFTDGLSKLSGIPAADIASSIQGNIIIKQDLVSFVQQLRSSGYKIACLSNGTVEWTQKVIDDNGLTELFDQTVISGDVGVIKPSPAIYKVTLKRLGVTASQAVFVDDRAVNTEAAEACGIKSFLFTDTQKLIAELKAAGIS
ncbi:MAG: putative (S)-2-haloacid dehalogenase [Candidatus Saccharibacteria bacterium]|nr:putative (S)-2-haloacid dehalogenase [Candidatus Saccharibacteria bacterium]